MLLDGKIARNEIAKELSGRIAALHLKPRLVIVQVGDNEESAAYIRQKKLFGESIGAAVEHLRFPESITEEQTTSRIRALNRDASAHGIIIQLPVPAHLDVPTILNVIARRKDVDGLGARSPFTPATARGVLELLRFYRIPIRGRRAAILGRSLLVGTPTAKALEEEGAAVSVCHSETSNTREITRASNIVVVAIGRPRFIGADYFRGNKTQVVVDVGINPVAEQVRYGTGKNWLGKPQEEVPGHKFVGDVDFEAVAPLVAAISPVPGGVGPMTVTALFENLVEACERRAQ